MEKMYITRFTLHKENGAWGNAHEDYYYHTEQDAIDHMRLFADDDSGLYKSVAVILDEGPRKGLTVLRMIPFENGTPCHELSAGDIVRLRPGYATEEELRTLYTVVEMNENAHCAKIQSIGSGMAFPPVERVGVEMIAWKCSAADIVAAKQ